jgi:hypothetical protein
VRRFISYKSEREFSASELEQWHFFVFERILSKNKIYRDIEEKQQRGCNSSS